MGIDGLTKFVCEKAPSAVSYHAPESFIGRVVAIDASLSLYQFMVAIRDGESYGNLTNAAGETTSHLAGMLSRAIRIMELGMKPVYVFDGKAPTLKSGELAKRKDRKALAETNLEDAKERGDVEKVRKFAGRTVKVTRQHNEDVKKLLRLMGIPIVEAPGEAEAQCAVLCKASRVYATVTEDADALCFGTPILMRHLTFSDPKNKANKLMIVDLEKLLTALNFTMEQFVDFCILCGCDYCDTIKGIGPGSAYKLIEKYKDIRTALEHLDPIKYPMPENFPYEEARSFFFTPDVTSVENIEPFEWNEPDENELLHFLVDEQNFAKVRVENAIIRLRKAKTKGAQMRLETFFRTSVRPAVASEVKMKTESKVSGNSKTMKKGPKGKKNAPKA